MAKTIISRPMWMAPKNEPVVVISAWDQVMLVTWDDAVGKWRYGARPGEVWDADYPTGHTRIMNGDRWVLKPTDE